MNGISENERDDPSILRVMITNRCNMTCSFCSAERYMFTDGEPTRDGDTEAQTQQMVEVLASTPSITNIVWAGGEPLINWNRISGMLAAAQAVRPDVTHELVTNGHYIKLDRVDVLQQFQKITVSFDGYKQSERPLWDLVKNNRLEPLEAMRQLKNLYFRSVITRDQLANPRWYEDLIELHEICFAINPHGITLIFDTGMTKPLSPDHVLNFIYGWKQLKWNIAKMNATKPGSSVFIGMEKIFTFENCNRCSESLMLKTDGELEYKNNAKVVTDSGCNHLAPVIGLAAYDYLKKFLGGTA